MARQDPLRNFRYRLEINSITQAGFSEVTIAETTIEAVEYREGTDPPHQRKLSGLTKYGNVTLKAGVTIGGTAMDLYKWARDISAGQIASLRKRVVIVVQDEAGQDRARFVIADAWPIKYHPSGLSGKGNEVFIEQLELANEGIERIN